MRLQSTDNNTFWVADTALLKHAKVSALPMPNDNNVEALRTMLVRGISGPLAICGDGSNAWGKIESTAAPETKGCTGIRGFLYRLVWPRKEAEMAQKKDRDLVTVHARQDLDACTRWVMQELIPLYHDCFCSSQVNTTNDPRYVCRSPNATPKVRDEQLRGRNADQLSISSWPISIRKAAYESLLRSRQRLPRACCQ